MKTILFGNGDIVNYDSIRKYCHNAELIICCDGGLQHAHAMQIMPDYIVGDLDSCEPALVELYEGKGVLVERHAPKKDCTDMELAIDLAINKNATELFIFGGLGGRFDHSLANAHVLYQALEKRVHAMLITETTSIHLIDHQITLWGKKGDLVSLIPLTTEVTGVVTYGLEYPLLNETLKIGFARGVSNVLNSSEAGIKIKSGLLLVIRTLP